MIDPSFESKLIDINYQRFVKMLVNNVVMLVTNLYYSCLIPVF